MLTSIKETILDSWAIKMAIVGVALSFVPFYMISLVAVQLPS